MDFRLEEGVFRKEDRGLHPLVNTIGHGEIQRLRAESLKALVSLNLDNVHIEFLSRSLSFQNPIVTYD
jgi:hypothetical protein